MRDLPPPLISCSSSTWGKSVLTILTIYEDNRYQFGLTDGSFVCLFVDDGRRRRSVVVDVVVEKGRCLFSNFSVVGADLAYENKWGFLGVGRSELRCAYILRII